MLTEVARDAMLSECNEHFVVDIVYVMRKTLTKRVNCNCGKAELYLSNISETHHKLILMNKFYPIKWNITSCFFRNILAYLKCLKNVNLGRICCSQRMNWHQIFPIKACFFFQEKYLFNKRFLNLKTCIVCRIFDSVYHIVSIGKYSSYTVAIHLYKQ